MRTLQRFVDNVAAGAAGEWTPGTRPGIGDYRSAVPPSY